MHNNELLDLLEIIVARLSRIPVFWVLMLFFTSGIPAGIFLFIKPVEAIEIQRKFYARINWKIEPISMEREIRNTRFMGLALTLFLLAALIFILANKPLFYC